MLGTDLFAFAAFETVGRFAAGHGMDDAVVMQPKPKFFLTLSMSDTPFVFLKDGQQPPLSVAFITLAAEEAIFLLEPT